MWVCLSPIENTWKQGVIIRNVVGVPVSFIVEINGQQYGRNKCDITFSSPKGDDSVVGGATGNQHAKEQVGTENKTDRLRPKTNSKVPKASNSSNITIRFSNVIQKYMYVRVAHCAVLTYYDQVAADNPK